MTELFETTVTGASVGPGIPMWQHGTSLNERAQELLSRFELVRSLGLSGASHLFLAHDRKPERVDSVPGDQVILKLLTKEAAIGAEQVQLFHLEAQAATQLSHSNIVRVTESHGVGGLHLCVIERKSNVETLRSRLDRTAWFEIGAAISIIHNIVSGLDYAHRSGIAHLNIAPENILLDGEGVAFVTGFGIPTDPALEWAHRLRSKSLSTQYQSPEQAAGDSVDCRSDLYSVGVLLFEMLTDRTPFNAEDAQAIRHKQMARPAPTAQLFRPDTPESVSQVVKRLLEKMPGDRFQTAGELLSELNALQGCTTDGCIAAVQSPNPQEPSVHETAASRELAGTESDDNFAAPGRLGFEEDRELIPDEIDLVGLATEGLDELETGTQNGSVLDLTDEEPEAFSIECPHANESPRRDYFEPPEIEVIAPGVVPLQPAGPGIETVPDFPTHGPDQSTAVARNKTAFLSAPPGARRPKALVAAFLCLLVLANEGDVANIFEPPASSSVSDGDPARPPAADTEATPAKPVIPISSDGESLPGVRNGHKATVGLRVERRSKRTVKRYARSGWRSSTRWTRPNRRGRR